MTRHRPEFGDRGQAFPVYIVAVAALLFLAFAFFAVGQASATRNGAQTAADAAALAWAQDARDQLRTGLLDALDHGGSWEDWLGGEGRLAAPDCAPADDFAARNDAVVKDCYREAGRDNAYTVEVETRYTVGHSVIPGTESEHGTAQATAVIEPRCRVRTADHGRSPHGHAPHAEFTCDDRDWSIEPGKGGALPGASDLFSVYLSD